MGHFKEIKIDRKDGWKYQTTLDNSSDGYRARVYVDDNGDISKDSYSNEYKVKNEKGKGKIEKDHKQKEGCLTKLWKAPFRLLWWVTKKALIILSLGLLSSWLNSDD